VRIFSRFTWFNKNFFYFSSRFLFFLASFLQFNEESCVMPQVDKENRVS